MSLFIEAVKLVGSAHAPLATGSVTFVDPGSLVAPSIRNAWDEDEDEAEEAEPSEDDEEDEAVPLPIEEEDEDDPFDDFDEEDFDDDFDDDFEEELEDDYEIEPDDTDMFPPKLDEDDDLLDEED